MENLSSGRAGKLLSVTVSLALGLILLTPAAAPGAKPRRGFSFHEVERCFMRRINYHRRARGLDALDWDKQLAFVARRHARKMARRRGGIWHDRGLGSKVTDWRILGQNTGRGLRCKSLARMFWGSSRHRANILGPWRYIGVGVRRVSGDLYVQQVFESRSNPGNIYEFP
jgi:uncharacterized protein YkwD